MADILSPLTSKEWFNAGLSRMLYPYLRKQLRLSHPVSSTNTNMSAMYTDILDMYCCLRKASCCSATCLSFCLLNPASHKKWDMVEMSTSINRRLDNSLCISCKYIPGRWTRWKISNWHEDVSFRKALSFGYGLLLTDPVLWKSWIVLLTVDWSTPKFWAILCWEYSRSSLSSSASLHYRR